MVNRGSCEKGRGFATVKESTTQAPVAQLDRASGYEPEGRLFESARAHHLSQQFCRFRRFPIERSFRPVRLHVAGSTRFLGRPPKKTADSGVQKTYLAAAKPAGKRVEMSRGRLWQKPKKRRQECRRSRQECLMPHSFPNGVIPSEIRWGRPPGLRGTPSSDSF
jgi:hypothetical protein